MKKYVLLVIFFMVFFLLAGGVMVRAQVKFGLKTGVNMANVSLDGPVAGNLALSNLTGFKAGPMLEVAIPVIGMGLDAAVLYAQQGFKQPTATGKESYRLNTLEMPVNLKWKLTLLKLIGVYGTAGPYLQFKLSENLTNQFKAKTFGAGLNLGAGVELLGHLQVGANYQWGLTENYGSVSGVSSLKGKTSTWSVTAAYLF
jgi:hypothetical protein